MKPSVAIIARLKELQHEYIVHKRNAETARTLLNRKRALELARYTKVKLVTLQWVII